VPLLAEHRPLVCARFGFLFRLKKIGQLLGAVNSCPIFLLEMTLNSAEILMVIKILLLGVVMFVVTMVLVILFSPIMYGG
jgi:hypothetical protein